MDITLQPAQIIILKDIKIEAVRDLFIQKRIIAKIKDLPRPIILWDGPDQYAAAGNWTNDTVFAQASAVLALSSIPWV